jgi:hypothetical protein
MCQGRVRAVDEPVRPRPTICPCPMWMAHSRGRVRALLAPSHSFPLEITAWVCLHGQRAGRTVDVVST